ncbi:MAG: hypothetical protein ACR2GD_02345 [Pyrinomonadaceae bacterium]
MDVRVSKRIDIRLVQFDYNPVFVKAKRLLANGASVDTGITNLSAGNPVVTSLQIYSIPKRRQNDFRIGFGIVFH